MAARAAPAAPADATRVKASPLARRIARETGVDLQLVTGSGPGGRVVRRDLDGASATTVGATAAAPPPAPRGEALPAPRAPAPSRPGAAAAYDDVPLTQIRKTIAKRLASSLGPIPHFFLTTEVDMERAAEARDALNRQLGDQGKVSFTDIILKATALALRKHRACNAWFQEDHIRYWNEVHIGMAVALDDGLITPVIRDADGKSLAEISREAKELAERARSRRLRPDEYTGSTFSVSNLGMFDIDQFTAVINPPEAGIIAVGSITPRPVVVDGQVAPRRRVRITMSCDHRVIDGATGAAFLKTLKQMLANPFDVLILGGGPAGYVAAIRAAQLGMRTALVEKEKLGGVCVNIGCIPTKALLHSAYIASLLREAKEFGVEAGAVKTDYGVAMQRSRKVSDQNSKGVEYLMRKNKVTVVKCTGVLQPGRKVKVGNDVYEAKKAVLIATGSRVKGLPQIGLEINKTTVISSDEALFLQQAQASDALAKSYKKRGIEVTAGAKVKKGSVEKDKVTLEVEANGATQKIEVATVLMAAGRAVNTENIGLAECGVQVTDRGFIKVDQNLQTMAPGYYAIGDVAGPPMLAHKCMREGVTVTEIIAGKKPHAIRYDNVPSVTYCHPEVASIGLTEDQCKERKLDYVAGRFPFSANGRARGTGETEGFVKILRDKKYGEILGAHIVGGHASEIIHELTVARENEYTVEEVELAIHAHPTMSEAVAQAALDSLGRVVDM